MSLIVWLGLYNFKLGSCHLELALWLIRVLIILDIILLYNT